MRLLQVTHSCDEELLAKNPMADLDEEYISLTGRIADNPEQFPLLSIRRAVGLVWRIDFQDSPGDGPVAILEVKKLS